MEIINDSRQTDTPLTRSLLFVSCCFPRLSRWRQNPSIYSLLAPWTRWIAVQSSRRRLCQVLTGAQHLIRWHERETSATPPRLRARKVVLIRIIRCTSYRPAVWKSTLRRPKYWQGTFSFISASSTWTPHRDWSDWRVKWKVWSSSRLSIVVVTWWYREKWAEEHDFGWFILNDLQIKLLTDFWIRPGN